MRATRAFVGAFGAGISLAVASSVALLVVSSVVAFNGWPDDLNGSSAPDVASLTDAGAAPARRSDRAVVPRVDLPAPRAGSAGVRGESTSGRERTTDSGRAEQTAVEPSDTTVTPVTPVEPEAPPVDSGPAPDPRRPEPRSTVTPVTDLVRDTTKAVGEAVTPVAPVVGGVLESVGAAGAETVDQVGQTLDGAVHQLLQ